jgi:hypothetical protein
MTMPITEGNPTQNITATVDPVAVAQIVREMQRQDVAGQKKESRFDRKVKSLLESGNVDKENLTEITSLQQAAIEDLKDELKTTGTPDMANMTLTRYNDTLSDAIDKYIEGDEPLEKSAKLLEHNVSEKLKKDPNFMAKFNSGQLDKRQIANAAKEVVESFSKEVLGRDKPGKGVAIGSGITGTAAASAIENAAPTGTIDDIVQPHRREAYFRLNSLFKRHKFSQDDAHKKAYEHAMRPYNKKGSAA